MEGYDKTGKDTGEWEGNWRGNGRILERLGRTRTMGTELLFFKHGFLVKL